MDPNQRPLPVKVVSCIEDPEVIEKVLQHLALKESPPLPSVSEARGPRDEMRLLDVFFKKTDEKPTAKANQRLHNRIRPTLTLVNKSLIYTTA